MKRALEKTQPTNFKERKKQKLADARTIAVQSPITTSNAVAGPSQLGPTINDKLKRLPGAIDVEKFAEAPWQVLPRHLRRRAASHNPRRVPLRLRDKARSEMDPMRRKVLGRAMPKLGKERRLPKEVIFMNRQHDKRWLETHIWHAKRMKMENMWGYRLAVTPTEKAFRPSHRASIHGSILHDASYLSLIEMIGPEATLKAILEMCCDAQDVSSGARRYTSGARVCKTHIYAPNRYPLGLICPITVMWKSRPSIMSKPLEEASKSKKGKGKDKQKEIPPEASDNVRVLWISFHPSMYDEVFFALRTSTSQTLEAAGSQGVTVDVELIDIRGEVGIFEIMGPKSNQVLRGSLSPVMAQASDDFKKFWASLGNIQSCGSVPRGMIIGFLVNDPRLRFPPKNAKVQLPVENSVSSSIGVFPSAALAACNVWEQNTRNQLKNPRYQTKDINARRAQNLIPGTPLNPLRQDDRIPVMLIQTSYQHSASHDTESIEGWTFIFPAGWSMAFLQQLTYTGTRVAGQRERQTQAFEAGTAYFPSDYPSTSAYKAHISARAEKEKAKWARTPAAKRVNYRKLGTRSPWIPDWEVVLGLKEMPDEPLDDDDEENVDDVENMQDLITTQREPEEPLEQRREDFLVDGDPSVGPWLLRGVEISSIVSDLSEDLVPSQSLLATLNCLRAKRSLEPLESTIKPDDLLKSALVSVRIKICSKGSPSNLSLVHSIPDLELQEWRKGLTKAGVDLIPAEVEFVNVRTNISLFVYSQNFFQLPDIVPAPSSIIGYITTGGFSLSRGEGFAIGAMSLTRLFELQQQAKRLSHYVKSDKALFVKVRDRKGHQCRLARIHVV
ncbi:POP1-domain-containing protein [Lentinula aff. lateritia]|uniref:POP1-domain-containing protein n=1 Tax=Lentinula aff. lateritia TaxID=2804960 RepID=A0ACC1UC40_9AGAR|nr:POP1-domain-containing protein [Lentinula aff. lateritia]